MNAAVQQRTDDDAPQMPMAPEPVLRLDRTRPFSTVHGDRVPEDPHYRVHFWQDDLPFDVNEVLVPDDEKRQPFSGPDPNREGHTVQYRPLYTPQRALKAQQKLDRLRKGAKAMRPPEVVDETSPKAEQQAAVTELNFAAWLRGEVQYETWQVFAAFETRYHRKTHKQGDVVSELVLEFKVIPEDQVAPWFKKYLESSAL